MTPYYPPKVWRFVFSTWASLVAQTVKNPPSIQETWVRSLCWEDPLEEGNGNLLQSSFLESSMDRGAWRTTVHGLAESWAQRSD